jgi:RNA polymerase sigma factor (sigma-70 family)
VSSERVDGRLGDRPYLPSTGAETVFVDQRDRLFRLACLLVFNPVVAEDLVADVFARCWRRLERGQIAEPRAYLTKALHNAARRQDRRSGLEQRWRAIHRPAAAPVPVDDIVAARTELVAGLGRLSPGQRTVLVLRFWDDLSEQQVASTLGVSIGTVKKQAHRGLSKLREELS